MLKSFKFIKLSNLKYLAIGIIIGSLLSVSIVQATNPIKLIVNGVDITYKSDVPPQIINGRTLVPARALAESLGATVEWDSGSNAVIITQNAVSNTLEATMNVEPEVKETTFKGMSAIEVNEQIYFNMGNYYHLLENNGVENNISYDKKTQTVSLSVKGKTATIIDLTNPNDAQEYKGTYYLNIKYFCKCW